MVGRELNAAILSSRQDDPAWPGGEEHALSAEDFRRIRSLVPPEVLLLATPVGDWLAELGSADADYIANAVPQRQAEFSTGRMLVARALGEFGLSQTVIGRGSVNEPIWPQGLVGSITHTRDSCMVAVADSRDVAGVGIDLEARREEFSDVGHLILRPDERSGAAEKLPGEDGVRLVFGAKEAIYKAVYAQVGRFVDFQEVRVDVDMDSGTYAATAPDDATLDGLLKPGIGRFLMTRELVFAIWCRA